MIDAEELLHHGSSQPTTASSCTSRMASPTCTSGRVPSSKAHLRPTRTSPISSPQLPLLPRYRQRVRFVPGQLGRPVWVDDPHFNLAYHVRHSALPPPGGEEELCNLMGRLMAVELDRHRPLWEVWMIEGLAGTRWALISKVHHCMVDGISGTDLMVQLLDAGRRHRKPKPEEWVPSTEPSEAELVVRAIVDLLSVRTEQFTLPGRCCAAREALTALGDTMDGAMALGRGLQPTPPALSIEGAIGPHRRWAVARTSLDELKVIRSTLGGTVNDVVLTAITGAFRDLLLDRSEPVDDVVIHSLVPVSVRAADDHTPNNQVAAMIAALPVGIGDPADRLESIRQQMTELKASRQAEASEAMSARRVHPTNALRARPTLGVRDAPPDPAAQREHGDDQRARAAVPALRTRPRAGRIPAVRAAFPRRTDRRGDPLLQRSSALRRHRRLRHRARDLMVLQPHRGVHRRAQRASTTCLRRNPTEVAGWLMVRPTHRVSAINNQDLRPWRAPTCEWMLET